MPKVWNYDKKESRHQKICLWEKRKILALNENATFLNKILQSTMFRFWYDYKSSLKAFIWTFLESFFEKHGVIRMPYKILVTRKSALSLLKSLPSLRGVKKFRRENWVFRKLPIFRRVHRKSSAIFSFEKKIKKNSNIDHSQLRDTSLREYEGRLEP